MYIEILDKTASWENVNELKKNYKKFRLYAETAWGWSKLDTKAFIRDANKRGEICFVSYKIVSKRKVVNLFIPLRA
jgi:hypothetical protein